MILYKERRKCSESAARFHGYIASLTGDNPINRGSKSDICRDAWSCQDSHLLDHGKEGLHQASAVKIQGETCHMSRMYKRLNISLPAIVAVNPATLEEQNFLLRTIDVSAAGAMFCSERTLPLSTPVKVVFLLNQGEFLLKKLRVMFNGRVVRCEPGRFAVAFDEVHPIIVSPESTTSQTAD